jgi:hypothetical protein
MVVSANDAASLPQSFASLTTSAYGNFDAATQVLATAFGSRNADISVIAAAYGAGSSTISIGADAVNSLSGSVWTFSAGSILLQSGAGFEIRDNAANPYFKAVVDDNGAQGGSIINNWGASSNPGVTLGASRTDSLMLRVVRGATISGGAFSGAYGLAKLVVRGGSTGGSVRVNQGGNHPASDAGAGAGGFIISNASTGDGTVFDHQIIMGVTTVANLGWIQMVDPGVAYYTMAINPNGGQVALGPGPYNLTTGSAANMHLSSGAFGYNIYRFTSARKYKQNIDYDAGAALADMQLRPARFYREDDDREYYGFIADDMADQDPLFGYYNKGEIENYDEPALLAIMAAKINRLERNQCHCST